MSLRKYLCLTAFAALAFTALASTASASFVASESSTITATPTGQHEIGLGGNYTPCTASGFSVNGPTGTESFQPESLADYTCTFFGNPKLKLNGCKFIFHPETETSADVYKGTAEIGPVDCGPVSMTYLGGACQLQIQPKKGLATIYSNTGKGSEAAVSMAVNATNLEYTDSCGGSGTKGTYDGTWTLSASQGVHVTQVGVFIDSEGEEAMFDAEEHPVVIPTGGEFSLDIPGTDGAQCSEADLHTVSAQATDSLTFAGSYSDCSALGFGAAHVDMNSCSLGADVHYDNGYKGSAEINCAKGDAIEISPLFWGWELCTFRLPAQSIGSMAYANWGGGHNSAIGGAGEGSGISYEDGAQECGIGSGDDATLAVGLLLKPGYTAP